MMQLTRIEAETFLRKLLVGMETDFFISRPSFFILYMSREKTDESLFPAGVQLYFSDFWYMGDKAEWDMRVSQFGEGVDPDVSIQAFELTKIFTSGDTISEVSLGEKSVSIRFKSEAKIVSYCPEDDYTQWLLLVSEASECLGIGERWFEFADNVLWARTLSKKT